MKENRFASERARENENRSIDRRRRVPPRDRSFSSGGGVGSRSTEPFLRPRSTYRNQSNRIDAIESDQSHAIQRNPTQSNPIQSTSGPRRSPPARDPTDRSTVTAPSPHRRARSIARTLARRRARRDDRRAARRDPTRARARMRSRASPATSSAPSRARERSSEILSSGVARARTRRRVGVGVARVDLPRASIRARAVETPYSRISGAPNPEFIASAPYLATIRARDGDFDRRSRWRRATGAQRAYKDTPNGHLLNRRYRAIGGGNTYTNESFERVVDRAAAACVDERTSRAMAFQHAGLHATTSSWAAPPTSATAPTRAAADRATSGRSRSARARAIASGRAASTSSRARACPTDRRGRARTERALKSALVRVGVTAPLDTLACLCCFPCLQCQVSREINDRHAAGGGEPAARWRPRQPQVIVVQAPPAQVVYK